MKIGLVFDDLSKHFALRIRGNAGQSVVFHHPLDIRVCNQEAFHSGVGRIDELLLLRGLEPKTLEG